MAVLRVEKHVQLTSTYAQLKHINQMLDLIFFFLNECIKYNIQCNLSNFKVDVLYSWL